MMKHFCIDIPIRNILLIPAIMVLPSFAMGAKEMDALSNWFQIEILVFAQQAPNLENEFQPLPSLEYPPEMMTILPANKKALKPLSLWQLEDQLQYQALGLSKRNVRQPPNRGIWQRLRRLISGSGSGLPDAFVALGEKQRMLNPEVRRLKRSPQYRPIHHLAWQQPIVSGKSETTVMIQAGQRYDDFFEIDGTLTFSRSRYVHVNADLWFTIFAQFEDAGEQRKAIEVSLSENTALRRYPEIMALESNRNQFTPYQVHRLKEKRRLKSGKLGYLDNPAFGLLIKVDKYNWAEEEKDSESP